MDRIRERQRERESLERADYNDKAMEVDDLLEKNERPTSSLGGIATANNVNSPAANYGQDQFRLPEWLSDMAPCKWPNLDEEGPDSSMDEGRNCCLFYPIDMCRGSSIINGICLYHIRAIFNAKFTTDSVFHVSADRKPTISQKSHCLVADPQEIDNVITPVFPIFEFFDSAPRIEDIKMFHLIKFLHGSGEKNWQKIAAVYTNYLLRLMTVHHHPWKDDQMSHSQMLVHWNTWNRYNSWVLKNNPADISIVVASKDNPDNVNVIPISNFTTVTQMIIRLFDLPYSSMNNGTFVSTLPNYNFAVRNHLAYSNNLCSCGTITHQTAGNCYGNALTLPMVRTDIGTKSLICHSVRKRCNDYTLSSKLNWNAPFLNRYSIMTKCPSIESGKPT